MSLRNSILLVIFLLFVSRLPAQTNPVIKVSLNKNKILIGEPALFTIEGDIPAGRRFIFKNIDSIPHFEFLESPKIDTIKTGTTVHLKAIYQIRSFDSGHWVIPSFQLATGIKTDSIAVDVVFSDFDPTQDYHGIKDIIEVSISKKKFPWWWFAAAAILIGTLLYYLIKKKKPVVVQAVRSKLDPYEEAMNRLDQLIRNKPAIKTFYSELTDILRVYIYRSRGILSLQKTTADLVLQLSSAGLSKLGFEELSQALRLSDFVKFAKYNSSPEDDSNVYKTIRDSITELKKLQTQPIAREENN